MLASRDRAAQVGLAAGAEGAVVAVGGGGASSVSTLLAAQAGLAATVTVLTGLRV